MSSPADPTPTETRIDPAGGSDRSAPDPTQEAVRSFMAELAAHGVKTVIASPGSRNTPLLVAASRTPGLDLTMRLDERQAAFTALGAARSSGRPALLMCTSGSAAANYLPAVVEAHHSHVPLIFVTADRPPELRGWGAGQTIDQVGIYGPNVRWFAEMPLVDPSIPHRWFAMTAARAVVECTGPPSGPVHLNWPFREPLVPGPGDLTPVAPTGPRITTHLDGPVERTWESVRLAELAADLELGVIVAGPMDPDPATVAAIREMARVTGWPLLAEPTSKLRFPDGSETDPPTPVTGAHDLMLRAPEWTRLHQPDVVVRIGSSPTSKALRQWLEGHPPEHHILIDPHRGWNEASFTLTEVLHGPPGDLCGATVRRLGELGLGRGSSGWTRAWLEADAGAQREIDAIVDSGPLLEAGVARALGRVLGPDTLLMVANSMPVRDVDSFWPPDSGCGAVFANRGANGIDGLVSTAVGLQLGDPASRPICLLTGDLALLHDVGALLSAAGTGVDMTVVVPDNGGGGIFSFLPVSGAVSGEDFLRLFHTPPEVDLAGLGEIEGVTLHRATDIGELVTALGASIGRAGVDLIRVEVDTGLNVAQHRLIVERVTATLEVPGGER